MKEDSRSPSQELQANAAVKPSHVYDEEFVLTDEYRASLPDMQNADSQQIYGANVPILKVGISNFRMPLRYITPISDTHTLETSVTGTVSLEANQKGINMSRIMRVFYDFQDRIFTPDLLQEILLAYKATIRAHRAQLKLEFEYPIKTSLRSGLEGWQYYKCAFEGKVDELTASASTSISISFTLCMSLLFELSEHARGSRNVYRFALAAQYSPDQSGCGGRPPQPGGDPADRLGGFAHRDPGNGEARDGRPRRVQRRQICRRCRAVALRATRSRAPYH